MQLYSWFEVYVACVPICACLRQDVGSFVTPDSRDIVISVCVCVCVS